MGWNDGGDGGGDVVVKRGCCVEREGGRVGWWGEARDHHRGNLFEPLKLRYRDDISKAYIFKGIPRMCAVACDRGEDEMQQPTSPFPHLLLPRRRP